MKKSILAVSIGAAISFAAQADVLITEYVEGGAGNKAIELYNSGAEAVVLSTFELVRFKDGAETPSKMLSLSGISLAPDEVIVVRNNATDTPLVNGIREITNSNLAHNGGDAIALTNNGSIVDIIGDVPTPKSWGKDVTYRRVGQAVSQNYIASDWAEFGKDDISGLGNVNQDGGTTTTTTAPDAVRATIMALQGDSWASPYTDPANSKFISDETFLVEGVVTAIQTTALGKDLPVGFFIQDEQGDGNPNTSDGIFVTGKIDGLSVGDKVSVTGKVKEDYGWTKLEPNLVEKNGHGHINPTTVLGLDSDADFDFTLERHEGMLVRFDAESDMRITRTFNFDYGPKRYNMTLSHGQVNMHPNQHNAPVEHDKNINTDAERQVDCNEDRRIVVESFEKVRSGNKVPYYPEFGQDNGNGTTDDYLRVGDVVDGLEGVITYSYSDYRFYATNTITRDNLIRKGTDRTEKPVLKEGGDLRIATFNVLNYFNSPFGGTCNPTSEGSRDSVAGTGCGNRGAASEAEFELQGDKIASAILAIDADIIGLMEVENNGFGDTSAVYHLVDKLNSRIDDKSKQYAYIAPEDQSVTQIGTDAIANQVIFRPAKVTLDKYRIIELPQQHAPSTSYPAGKGEKTEDGNNYQRDSVSPTFKVNGTDEKLTVSINHFKSKGSTCWEDAAPIAEGGQAGKDTDKQGSCESFRVSAAYHLGEELNKIDGHKIILGDLNSYASEDPLLVLTNRDKAAPDYQIKAARNTYIGGNANDLGKPLHGDEGFVVDKSYGYVSAVAINHPNSYSYSYKDEVGTLDYILISPSLMPKFVDAIDWNINAGESTMFQYSDKNNCFDGVCSTRHADHIRSSDHDPAIIDLKLGVKPEPIVIDENGNGGTDTTGTTDTTDTTDTNNIINVIFNIKDNHVTNVSGNKIINITGNEITNVTDNTVTSVIGNTLTSVSGNEVTKVADNNVTSVSGNKIRIGSEPEDKPVNIAASPEKAVVGKEIKVLFDLMAYNLDELTVGDKLLLSLNKAAGGYTYSKYAFTSGGQTTETTLTAEDIKRGWAIASITPESAGEYKLMKLIKTAQGSTSLDEVDVSVSGKSDSALPNEKESIFGGSTGLLSLLALAGAAFLRRRNIR